MPPTTRTSRDGLHRGDLRRQARLRVLAVAAGAASTSWMVQALAQTDTATTGATHAAPGAAAAARRATGPAVRSPIGA